MSKCNYETVNGMYRGFFDDRDIYILEVISNKTFNVVQSWIVPTTRNPESYARKLVDSFLKGELDVKPSTDASIHYTFTLSKRNYLGFAEK